MPKLHFTQIETAYMFHKMLKKCNSQNKGTCRKTAT